jgi:hypothetical protein
LTKEIDGAYIIRNMINWVDEIDSIVLNKNGGRHSMAH